MNDPVGPVGETNGRWKHCCAKKRKCHRTSTYGCLPRMAWSECRVSKSDSVESKRHPGRTCICLYVHTFSPGAEAPLHETPGGREREEGLQRRLHCVSWERREGCPDGEH